MDTDFVSNNSGVLKRIPIFKRAQIPLAPPTNTLRVAVRETNRMVDMDAEEIVESGNIANIENIANIKSEPNRNKKQKRDKPTQDFQEFDRVNDPDGTQKEMLMDNIMEYFRKNVGIGLSINHLKDHQREYNKVSEKPLRPGDIQKACNQLVKRDVLVHSCGKSTVWKIKTD